MHASLLTVDMEPNPAYYDLIIVHASLLTAEPNPAYGLKIVHVSVLTAEPNPVYDFIVMH